LLTILREHRDEFVQYCDERHLDREIHLVAMMEQDTPIGFLSTEQVADIASFGCSIDIDLYCFSRGDEDHD
jgi:hypothetical protein